MLCPVRLGRAVRARGGRGAGRGDAGDRVRRGALREVVDDGAHGTLVDDVAAAVEAAPRRSDDRPRRVPRARRARPRSLERRSTRTRRCTSHVCVSDVDDEHGLAARPRRRRHRREPRDRARRRAQALARARARDVVLAARSDDDIDVRRRALAAEGCSATAVADRRLGRGRRRTPLRRSGRLGHRPCSCAPPESSRRA